MMDLLSSLSGNLMVQVVVMQCIIWYTLLLFLFEYRGAKMLIMDQFPETAASIVSFKVDSDVVSLDGRDFLETDAEIGDDGKLHVTVRKSNASRRSSAFNRLWSQNFTPKEVIVSRKCAEAVLRGAQVYAPSVLACSANVEKGDLVTVSAAVEQPGIDGGCGVGITRGPILQGLRTNPHFVERNAMYIGNNYFTGTLPLTLYSCKLLTAVRLASNRMEGQITPDILTLQSLSFLFISDNKLTNITGANTKIFVHLLELWAN